MPMSSSSSSSLAAIIQKPRNSKATAKLASSNAHHALPHKMLDRIPERAAHRVQCKPLSRPRLLDLPAAPSAAHNPALRALGLLDFVRLDLASPGTPRPDLVAALIANYDFQTRRSYVRGAGITVSRLTFTAALSLPRMPVSNDPPPGLDPAAVASAASEFMRAYILPPVKLKPGTVEWLVRAAAADVWRGCAHQVDWATLIWNLAYDELTEMADRRTEECRYGAYWQRLIWLQRPDIFHSPPSPPVAKRSTIRAKKTRPAVAKAPPDSNRSAVVVDKTPELGATTKQLDQDAKLHLHDMKFKMQDFKQKVEQDKDKLVDELRTMESLNQALLIKERRSNDELQAVRKQLIHVTR
ncbi:hypothetical protein E2562_036214 [Oryza meyeriana var. granulata]|uniref:Uncharacterized protein n=1 Tax=Oryza meyeriana var. granulata TaxID=110450 RepID=A0A6G1ET41_9ORYZ|nr:hypothetical protein E2562_036214 [Oryza meyeriana var. granulata]